MQLIHAKFSHNHDGKPANFEIRGEYGANGCYSDPDYGESLFRIQHGFYFIRRRWSSSSSLPRGGGWTIFLEPSGGRSKTTTPVAVAWGTGRVWIIQDGPQITAKTSGVIVVSTTLQEMLLKCLEDLDGLLQLQVVEETVPEHMKGSKIAADLSPRRIRWSVPVTLD